MSPFSETVRTIIALGVVGVGAAYAQDFPNRPIRIVTAVAGGGSDFVTRLIAQGLQASMGQPMVVDNRGSGVITGDFLLKSPPDGYSLTVTGSSFWVGPLLQKVPYEVVNDFTPISLLAREVFVVVVHPSIPSKSIKELIALAKARPGELNYSSGIAGGPPHLSGELFKTISGTNVVRVGYRGTAPAITAVASGEVQLAFYDASLVMPLVKAGRLKALAVTSATPSTVTPGLPTVASTMPGYESVGMTVMLGPGKMPAALVTRLNQEVVRVLNRPDVKEKMLAAGEEIVGSSPEQLAAAMKADIAKWEKVIKDAGIRVE